MEPLLLTWSSVLWRSMQSSNGPVYTSLHRHRQLLIERSPTLMPAMSVRGPSGGFFKLFFFIIYWRVLRSVIDLNSTHRFCWGEEKVLKFLFVRLISFFGATKRKNWIFSHLDGNGNFWSNRSVSLNLHCFHFEFSLALLECGRVSVTTVPTGCCHCRRHLSISDAFSQLWNSRILLMPPPLQPSEILPRKYIFYCPNGFCRVAPGTCVNFVWVPYLWYTFCLLKKNYYSTKNESHQMQMDDIRQSRAWNLIFLSKFITERRNSHVVDLQKIDRFITFRLKLAADLLVWSSCTQLTFNRSVPALSNGSCPVQIRR